MARRPRKTSARAWAGAGAALLAAGVLLAGPLAPALAAQEEEGPERTGLRESSVVLTRLPLSVRSLSFAGALPLVNPDPDLFLRNPASAERGRGMGVSVQAWEADARLLVMSAGTAWFGGGAALGVRHATYLVSVEPPGGGLPTRPAAAGDRMRFAPAPGEPAASVSETAVTVGYGRLFKGFRVGVAASALEVRRGADAGSTGFVDLGVARDIGRFALGLSGGSLGPSPELGDDFRTLPAWATLGVGSQAAPVGPLDITGAFALTWREGGDLEAGGGLEFGWWPVVGRTFVGRVGVGGPAVDGASRITLGTAFLGDAFTVEYAWRGVDGARGIHGVSLRFR
ncbi:MAG: hypothetical protein EA350_06635 [Gemmatimonadales bacterium]|nr:MAG: hypothetical protein EA350_06635 [Gemmatimonadales bacterium]